MTIPHADLVQHQLERLTRPPALEVTEEMPDNASSLLGHPVQHVFIREVVGSYAANERRAWTPTLLDIESRVLLC